MVTFNTQPQSINDLPLDDPIVDSNGNLTDVWRNSLSQLTQFLADQLSQLGHFTPNITTAQRNAIQNPVNAQRVWDTDLDIPMIYEASSSTWRTETIT